MSYLARAVSTRRLALATSIDSMKTLRCFSVSFSHQKGPIETTKETLKKVDRTVSNVAVKGIETGEKAARKAKETMGYEIKETKDKVEGVAGQAKEKAKEEAHKASGEV